MSLIPSKGEKSKMTMANKNLTCVAPVAPGQPGVMTKCNSWNSGARAAVDLVKTNCSASSSPNYKNSPANSSSSNNKNSPAKPPRPKQNKPNTRIPKPKGKENAKGVAVSTHGAARGPRIAKPVVRPSKQASSSAFGPDCSSESNRVVTAGKIEDCAMIDQITQSPFNHSPFSPFIATSNSSLTSTPSSTHSNHYSSPGPGTGQHYSSPGPGTGQHYSNPGPGMGQHYSSPGPGTGQHYSSPGPGAIHRTSSLLTVMKSPGFSPQLEKIGSQSASMTDLTPNASPGKMHKSPLFLSSRAMPDLHSKLLAKLKANKRRSGCQKTPIRSPTKAPAPKENTECDDVYNDIDDDEDVFCGEGESDCSVGSVSSSRSSSACSNHSNHSTNSDSPNPEELEFLLRSMFTSCDEYRTGQVPAGKLLDYLLALVEVPSLNKWKIDELSRMLDPQQDNRYVDEELFQEVGKLWVGMMLDPMCHDSDCHPTDQTGGDQRTKVQIDINSPSSTSRRRVGSHHDFDISYGSMEALGGVPGCSSDEVELENRVSELRYQLARAGEDQVALQNALAMQEESNAILTNELDLSRRRVGALKEMVDRSNLVHDELDEVKMRRSQTDEQCCNLSVQVEQLMKEKEQKALLEEEKENLVLQLAQCRKEIQEKERREKELLLHLSEKEQECSRLGTDVVEREDQLNEERDAREGMEERLEDLSREVERMEVELSVKDHELRSFTNNTGVGANTSNSSSLNLSTLHDVSVDDRVLEEARVKPVTVTPSRLCRPPGPSASSTPSSSTKKTDPVSICDEMKQLGLNSSFPSPLCEKESSEGGLSSGSGGFSCLLQKFRKELESKQTGLTEKLRKVICGEAEAEETGRMMVALNQTMAGFTKDLMDKYTTLVHQLERNEKGRNNLKDKLAQVEDNNLDKSDVASPAFNKNGIKELSQKLLEEKNQTIQDLEKELREAKEDQILDQDIKDMEVKVREMAELLQMANQALLAAGLTISRENSRAGTPNRATSRCSRPLSPQADTSMDLDMDNDNDLLSDWQHDYDGLELIEWNNNLSKKLMQYANASRLLLGGSVAQDFSLLGKSGLPTDFHSDVLSSLTNSRIAQPVDINGSRTLKSAPLFSKLAELHHEATRSRDLLIMASESMTEDMSIQEVMSLREDPNMSHNLVAPKFPKTVGCQTEQIVEEALEAKEEKDVENGEEVEGTWWPPFLIRLVCAILLVLVYFTFFCGLEIEGVQYYPFTWYPLRYAPCSIPVPPRVTIKWSFRNGKSFSFEKVQVQEVGQNLS